MSDIEDGELFSDNDNECFEDGKKDTKVKLVLDCTKHLQFEDTYQSTYEQINIVDEKSRSSISDEEYMQQNCCNINEGHDDQQENILLKPSKHVENVRKRSSEHFQMNSESSSSDENEPPQHKRLILCKYYASSECPKGATCAFMHEEFPCKFFHDETAVCRAENKCKFSHKPLTEEMKKVLDDFIQEGKEKLIQSAISTIKNASFINSFSMPQTRPNCLLPTPLINESSKMHSFDPDFRNSYRDISNYPSVKNISSSKLIDIIPNYPIANKSQLLQKYPKPGLLEPPQECINFLARNRSQKHHQTTHFISDAMNSFQRLLHNIENSDNNQPYEIESENIDSQLSFASNEENVVPPRINKLNSKIHAPARFIMNNEQKIKAETEEVGMFDSHTDYKDALRRLADQIVIEQKRVSPSTEKFGSFEELAQQPSSNHMTTWIDNSYVRRDVVRMDNGMVKMCDSISIFKDENNMNESEKMYIARMKSLSNVETSVQTEFRVPWNLQRLESSNKQPYLLYVLKNSDIHDNPLADPRLIGHPVLNNYLKENPYSALSSDIEEYSPLLMLNDVNYDNEASDDSEQCV